MWKAGRWRADVMVLKSARSGLVIRERSYLLFPAWTPSKPRAPPFRLPFLALQHLGQSHSRSHGVRKGSCRLAACERPGCPITGGSRRPGKLSSPPPPPPSLLLVRQSAALTVTDSCGGGRSGMGGGHFVQPGRSEVRRRSLREHA